MSSFLIGTVPGCDLRVPGGDLPAGACLLARIPEGLTLRKLAPTQIILVNGKTATRAESEPTATASPSAPWTSCDPHEKRWRRAARRKPAGSCSDTTSATRPA